MAKNKNQDLIGPDEVKEIQKEYMAVIETDPKYSLEVDPENKYQMTEAQKEFIKYYVQFKNVPVACKLAGITEAEGKAYFVSFTSQQEIRRINLAMYHHQFSARLLSIDEIGGYLTSLLMDNVPVADQIGMKEKLQVAKMIIDLNTLKQKSFNDPKTIEAIDLTNQIKDLSVKSIKQLLDNSKNTNEKMDEKDEVIYALKEENQLSPEEVTYLKTLPLQELLELLERGNS